MNLSKRNKIIVAVSVITALTGLYIFIWIKWVRKYNNKMNNDKNIKAFLAMIRHAEGTSGANGYRTLFGGKLFTDFSTHPNVKVPFRNTYSTAAGAYQILYRTWLYNKTKLGLKDFSPESQDKIAIELIRAEKALDDVLAGRFATAIDKVQNIWASLPDVPGGEKAAGYNQNPKKLTDLQKTYTLNGGQLA